jgi:cell division protein FtsI/penicillin-binding protein 2
VTQIDRRIGLLFLAFLCLLGIAVTRAMDLGTLQAGSLRRAASTQQVQNVRVPAPRGTITDRNGVQLAISESADDVIADPYLIDKGNPASVAAKLAPLVSQPVGTVQQEITKPHTGYVDFAHLIPADTALQISNLRINGITLTPEVKRVYPRGDLAAQVLGTVGFGDNGSWGVEYRYNKVLAGRNGIRRIVYSGNGQAISINDLRATEPGKTIQLTIDSALQAYVEQVLAGVGQQYHPKGATAIVTNPNTGAILALANWPAVNPNNPAAASSPQFEDQAVGFSYEPGSTFKAITVAGALSDGLVTPSTQFTIPPDLYVDGKTITDAEAHGYEQLSVAGILKYSSNIGADEIGQRLGPQRFDAWVHKFGFGSPTGVDLPGEQQGIVLNWWKYSGTSMFNLPFGQGESVTPMQMVTAYDAIANGGILRAPHVVASIGGKATPLPAGHRVISTTVASEIRGMLRGVLADGGTASGAAIAGFDLAGKTGTANIAIDGKYSDSEYVASFIGFVPASAPKLEVTVVVDQPQGNIYGGSVAAPAFQKIVGWAVPYFGIDPH